MKNDLGCGPHKTCGNPIKLARWKRTGGLRFAGTAGPDKHGKIECAWKATADKSYQDWAKEQVRLQLAKAGFRLAALMREIFE